MYFELSYIYLCIIPDVRIFAANGSYNRFQLIQKLHTVLM